MQPTEKDFPFYVEFQFAFLNKYSKYVHLFATKCIYFRKNICVLRFLLFRSFISVMAYNMCHVINPSLSLIKYRWFSFVSKWTWIFSFTLLIVHCNSHAVVVWIWPSNLVNKVRKILYSLMNLIYVRADGWDESALKSINGTLLNVAA